MLWVVRSLRRSLPDLTGRTPSESAGEFVAVDLHRLAVRLGVLQVLLAVDQDVADRAVRLVVDLLHGHVVPVLADRHVVVLGPLSVPLAVLLADALGLLAGPLLVGLLGLPLVLGLGAEERDHPHGRPDGQRDAEGGLVLHAGGPEPGVGRPART